MVGKRPSQMRKFSGLGSSIFEKPQSGGGVNQPKTKLPPIPTGKEAVKPKVRPRDIEREIAEVRKKRGENEREKEEEEKRVLEEMRKQREKERRAALADAQALLHSSPLPGGNKGKKRSLPPWAQKGTKEKGLRRSV